MAFNKPVRFLYQGDRVVALRYVREARRLLFIYENWLTKSGAQSGRHKVKLKDGVVIELVVAINQCQATITVPPGKKVEVRAFDDFVTLARTATYPDGRDPDHPEQILRAPLENQPWRTFFYDANTEGYDDFSGPKGTYRRNPDGTELFPDGIPSAGNVDWLGPNGERISWYGPDTRYWYDAYRQPKAQYGKFVFSLGQVLLDVDQYCIDSNDNWTGRYVMGAGIRDMENGDKWLYVVTANLPDVDTPSVSVPANSVYFSTNFPTYDVQAQIRAVRLIEDRTSEEAMKWKPDPTQQVFLWQAAIPAAVNPWVFNQDCTKVVSFVHSLHTQVTFSDQFSNQLFEGVLPIEDSYRIDVAIVDPFDAQETITPVGLAAGGGRAPCAVDFNAANEEITISIAREPFADSPLAVVMYFGDLRLPMWFRNNSVAAGYTEGCVRRTILWADAREGAAVFSTQTNAWTTAPPPRSSLTQIHVEITKNGNFLRRILSAQSTVSGSSLDLRDRDVGALQSMGAVKVAPFVYLWMLSAQYTFFGFRAQILGLAGSNALRPHDTADCFGQYGTASGAPTTSQPVPTVSMFFNNRADKHGHKVSCSGAAHGDNVLYSGADPKSVLEFEGAHDASVSFVTGNDFPTLTGVSGTYQRYHPVWIMGLPIGGERPPIATP